METTVVVLANIRMAFKDPTRVKWNNSSSSEISLYDNYSIQIDLSNGFWDMFKQVNES